MRFGLIAGLDDRPSKGTPNLAASRQADRAFAARSQTKTQDQRTESGVDEKTIVQGKLAVEVIVDRLGLPMNRVLVDSQLVLSPNALAVAILHVTMTAEDIAAIGEKLCGEQHGQS